MDYHQLTGHNEGFNTLACAISTVEKVQQLKSIQPYLAWKPLDVIKHTLDNTTQYARLVAKYPMTKHREARFPWDNRRRLREDVAMDTFFMATTSLKGYTCE